jgi:polyisoprenoid-binding protein YceI
MLNKYLIITALIAAFAGPAWAAAEHYEVDPSHTYPSFEFSHMGISVWRGKFDRTSGSITFDRVAKTGTVDIEIDMSSINFGFQEMDEHARSPNWFDVAKYPTASYRGKVIFDGDKPSTIDGEITIRGITRPADLSINLFKCIPHPMLKTEVCGADAEGELNWSEFGMAMSHYGEGEAGKVKLRIQLEALKQDD